MFILDSYSIDGSPDSKKSDSDSLPGVMTLNESSVSCLSLESHSLDSLVTVRKLLPVAWVAVFVSGWALVH